MRPARLGGGVVCAAAVLALLPFSPACRAQAVRAQPVVETPQQVNDRLRELSASLRMMPHDYVIGPGDLLSIYVFDVEELSREVRVSQTGTIGIPLVPVRLHVAGLTEMQTEQKIAEMLEANGLVTHADVSVSVKEHKSKPITIVGAVLHPMVYEADRPVTLQYAEVKDASAQPAEADWKPIEGQPGPFDRSGSFTWTIGPKGPFQFHIRLRRFISCNRSPCAHARQCHKTDTPSFQDSSAASR